MSLHRPAPAIQQVPSVPPLGQPAQPIFPPLQDPATSRKKHTSLVVGLSIAAVVALLAVIGFANKAPSTVTLTVVQSVWGEDGCDLGLGYFDVPGSAVAVVADGVTVANGALPLIGTSSSLSCSFEVAFPEIPSEALTYSITVGRRGTAEFSREDLVANSWKAELSLGL